MNFSRKTLALDYAPPDSSGTDDDLPASHRNRRTRGHIVGNGRSALGAHHPRVQIDMESQIHWLEQEAYCSVLKAFRAQADSISWEKNDLMNNLRRELRISDEEYGELKSRVDTDDIVKRIREWRQAGGSQSGLLHNAPAFSSVVSPAASALRKRQKTSHPIASLPMGAPSHVLHTLPDAATSSSLRGVPLGAKGEKSKPGHSLTGVSTMKSLQFPSTVPSGMGQVTNRSSFAAMEPGGAATCDPLIGRKVKTRWPADNHFYEAEITDYCEARGYALVYDKSTDNEMWEWVNLKEISPEDIKWEGEDPGIFDGVGRSGSGGGIKKPTGHNGAITDACRGRGSLKTNLVPSTHGLGKKRAHDIKILNTEILVKEVDRVFAASHPDPLEVEKVKKMLEEHEQSLLCVIASLADASDGESEEAGHWNQHGANPDDAILVA
ncbi:protein EMSY-LIKE 3-like isoform X2 [Iris pallida]|uniref:Protein EMSY-LIKE 3-like isoform X2 n=1 Tax=Iris pallida TaxID=29817 RepID=A0AAX6IHD1_IRIPA|nr:protein EMSY-LIKE 3-like isoform X2 [Iris pallida]KAJ6852214.1 protein EMSY-LIKE 3-like isoform X2 [Iris pallida]